MAVREICQSCDRQNLHGGTAGGTPSHAVRRPALVAGLLQLTIEMSAHGFWRATMQALLFTGLTTAGYLGMTWAESSLDRHSRAEEWLAPVHESETPVHESEAPALGRTLGRLEIPRLRLASLVVQGDDDKSLLIGVGHLPDTVLPWQDGNTVLAGHRDTDFRPLKDIRAGDVIRFQTATVTYDYVVRETSIVEPTDLTPLRATSGPTLTLITCYPFTFVGSAPNRFIVHAERTNVSPTFGPSSAKTS